MCNECATKADLPSDMETQFTKTNCSGPNSLNCTGFNHSSHDLFSSIVNWLWVMPHPTMNTNGPLSLSLFFFFFQRVAYGGSGRFCW